MISIINSTSVQQKLGDISSSIYDITYIVTKRGKGNMVILPYFDGCTEQIEEYLEQYELLKNRSNLEKKWKKSLDSGRSSLTV